MSLRKCNRSYYKYEASVHIWMKNQTEEEHRISQDTDILYNRLHFWNRKYIVNKYEKLLIEEIMNNNRVAMCELLQGELILVTRYTYVFE